jgi:signal transduction histidine kinase
MEIEARFQLRKADPRLLVIACIVLGICLYYTFVYAFRVPQTGITYDTYLQVIDLTPCTGDLQICIENQGKIRVDDTLLKIGDQSSEDLLTDRRLMPFQGYSPGDEVLITILREGEVKEIVWRIPASSAAKQIEFLLTPLLIFGPFWLVGTSVLLFMYPRDDRWRLLIILSYLTTLWIATGLPSATRVADSSLVLHALSWILLPVFIHLHLIVPTPLFKHGQRYLLLPIYIICLLLAAAELIQALPSSVYLIGVLLAILLSISILTYRSVLSTSSAAKLSSRLMLTGVILAFGPGLILWLVPTLLGQSPGRLVISLALLAIPILPVFYAYAIYKHQLGAQESRINRLLATYALFLLYLTVLGLSFLLTENWLGLAGEFLIFSLVVTISLMLTLIPLRHFTTRAIDHLAYGTDYSKEEIVHEFARRIPAVTQEEELTVLLKDELLPMLGIEQTALIRLNHEQVEILYQNGLAEDLTTLSFAQYQQLSTPADIYRVPANNLNESGSSGEEWIRLAIPLEGRTANIGLWLFGNRYPDNYYSKDDIELLVILSNQLAITLDNALLFTSLQKELVDRARAEQDLARYAERLSLLHELDQAILAANSTEEIGRVALRGVGELVPNIRTSIILFNFDRKTADALTLSSIADCYTYHESQLPIDQFQRVATNDKVTVWETEVIERMAGDSSVARSLLLDGVSSILTAPLVITNKTIGALNIASDESNIFLPEHAEIALEVANSVAVALNNARLRATITKHGQDLQQLSARLIRAQEDERKRISYELHDEMGQILTAITFNLAAIDNDIARNSTNLAEEKLKDTQTMVESLMAQVRSLALELRPTMLQDLGLVPTIRWYVNTLTKRRGITIQLKTHNVDGRFSEDVETALYRIIQEALTNISRHSEASHVHLNLSCQDSNISATIEDNGIGFEVDQILTFASEGKGVGLVAIQERVAALDGRFDIHSAPGLGTRLSVRLPILG